MRWTIRYDGKCLGSVSTNHSMTDEEICLACGVELAYTEEDYICSPENGKYILDELEIEAEY